MTRVDLKYGDPEDLEGLVLFSVGNVSDPTWARCIIASRKKARILALDELLRIDRENIESELEPLRSGKGVSYIRNAYSDNIDLFLERFPGDGKPLDEVDNREIADYRLIEHAENYMKEFEKQLWWKTLRKRFNQGLEKELLPDFLGEILSHVDEDSEILDLQRAWELSYAAFSEEPYYELVQDALQVARDGHPNREQLLPRYVGLVRSLVSENYERAGKIKGVLEYFDRNESVVG